jgi:RND superfamily putative drug exporter
VTSLAPGRSVDAPPGTRHTPLHRLGLWIARHRWAVLGVWVVILTGSGLLYPSLEQRLGAPDYTVRDSETADTQDLIEESFPQLGSEQAVVVFRATVVEAGDPRYRAVVDRTLDRVEQRPGVRSVLSPYADSGVDADAVSADRRVVIAVVGLDGSEAERADIAKDLQEQVAAAAAGGPVEAYLTGPSALTNDLSDAELHDQERAEMLGIPIALVVLVLALGAVAAGLLPIVSALASVLLCTALLIQLAGPLGLDRFVTVITTVIGIGVGIDYALFVVSRFREDLAHRSGPGRSPAPPDAVAEAVATTLRTSGRTIVTSGVIVMVALSSMILINGHIFMEIAVASALVVACCLVVGLTLLPALLAILGSRTGWGALPRRLQPADVDPDRAPGTGMWGRWGRTVLRHPLLIGLPALTLLMVLAWPTASIKLGLDWGLAALEQTPSGKGARIVATSFAPGAVGPVQVVVCGTGTGRTDADLDGVAALTSALRADPRVHRVISPTDVLDARLGGHDAARLTAALAFPEGREALSRLFDIRPSGRCMYLSVVLARPVDSPAASDFVRDLRDEVAPGALRASGARVMVGGLTAQYVDLSAETIGKLPWVVLIVLVLSFAYLMVVFRSVFVPAKAVLLNLLATAAALGLTVLVFQQGHGSGVLHFTSAGTLQAYLPVALFALLFGLSMDYEVFLVSRVQEEWELSGDNTRAVAVAMDHTARQITAGAAIMIAVFGSLLVADVLELKQFGFGLSVAVLIDATVVRLVLVPAAMGLASRANWWLPRWLQRILPRVSA